MVSRRVSSSITSIFTTVMFLLIITAFAAAADPQGITPQASASYSPAVLSPSFNILYQYTSQANAGGPIGRLLRDSGGNLYGMGGGGPDNYGVVFKLAPNGQETVLYTFKGQAQGDGAFPWAGLVRDSAGNLYGMTMEGGVYGYGTVFKLTPAGVETVLHSFQGQPDGGHPFGDLLLDSKGNLYGTTSDGGSGSCVWENGSTGCGTVFQISASDDYKVLYNFAGSPDGGSPMAALLRDAAGNLYGTTAQGGNVVLGSQLGTIFRVTPSGQETVLYRFTGGNDGQNPASTLVADPADNLYGTASEGGPKGWGTVFKLSPSGQETTLYGFPGNSTDGMSPEAGVVRDPHGNLFGTTLVGGFVGECSGSGCGTVFALTPTGKEYVLHRFTWGPETDGCSPFSALIRDPSGNLYGTTPFCGSSGNGTIYEIKP